MYRGSSSLAASTYKKGGHKVEEIFAGLIGGSTKGLPPQGKTDCVGKDSITYSVKKHAKANWQIFLYSLGRLENDTTFKELSNDGFDLAAMLRSFPTDADHYFKDKALLKSELPKIKAGLGPNDSLESALRAQLPDNEYFVSKINLQRANLVIAKRLEDEKIKRRFLTKAFFNDTEVKKLAVEDNENFHIFDASEVVECLLRHTSVDRSSTGGHSTDLSLPGQKVLLKTDRNLMELEVRNEPIHYRELRMNVKRDVCFELLDSKFDTLASRGRLVFRKLRKS